MLFLFFLTQRWNQTYKQGTKLLTVADMGHALREGIITCSRETFWHLSIKTAKTAWNSCSLKIQVNEMLLAKQ